MLDSFSVESVLLFGGCDPFFLSAETGITDGLDRETLGLRLIYPGPFIILK